MTQQQPQRQAPKRQFPTIDIRTGVGQLVSGNFHEYSDDGYQGKKLDKPVMFAMIAIPKNDPHIGQQFGMITQHTYASYNGNPAVQSIIAGNQQTGQQPFSIGMSAPVGYDDPFAWKIEDGDHPDNVEKPGRRNCWLLKFGTTQPVKMFANGQEINPKDVRPGAFVQVFYRTKINGNDAGTCGIYLNPIYVNVVGMGEEIVNNNAPPASQVFAEPVALPPGARAWSAAPAPAQQPTGAGGWAPAAAPQPAYTPPVTYAPPAGAPAVPAGAMPAPAPSTAPGGWQATASPSNPPAQPQQPAPGGWGPQPAAAPNYGWVAGPQGGQAR